MERITNHKKNFSFCAPIGILPMAQNRPIPGNTADRRKNCMSTQAAAARSGSGLGLGTGPGMGSGSPPRQ